MILITGADGIVGRALCAKLLSQNIDFLPIIRRRKPHSPINSLTIDLADNPDALMSHLSGVTSIVHLAAAVPHSTYHPDNYESADRTRRIDRFVQELQILLDVPVIYTSTCGLYDRSSQDLKCENKASKLSITSPYFEAKAHGERLFLSEGLSTVLRLSAPVGVGLKSQLVFSRFISTARHDGKIEIWGSGSREQDFIDTADIVQLIIMILRNPKPLLMNVASGVPITMLDLARIVVSTVGLGSYEFTCKMDPRDRETARYSISLAKDHYNWEPMTTLTKSIRSLINEDFDSNI